MEDPQGALNELFVAALDQPRHAREEFLASLDLDVRVEVELLLQAHDDAGNFLEKSPLAERRLG